MIACFSGKIQAELAERKGKINKEIREKENESVKLRQEIESIRSYIQAEENLGLKMKEFEEAMERSKTDLDELFENKVNKNFA